MKYAAVEIKTSGGTATDPNGYQSNYSILEFGAVLEDTEYDVKLDELPTFHRYIQYTNQSMIYCDPTSIATYANTMKRIADEEEPFTYIPINDLATEFQSFLHDNNICGPVTVAGHNCESYTLKFLQRLSGFRPSTPNHNPRIIRGSDTPDVTTANANANSLVQFTPISLNPSLLFWKPLEDVDLPDFETCKKRADISTEPTDTSIEDAKIVIQLIRVATEEN